MKHQYTFDFSIDEFRADCVPDCTMDIEFTVDATLWPGEPMVRYYPDGSGYPGSPDEWEGRVSHLITVDAVHDDGTVVPVTRSGRMGAALIEALNAHYDTHDDEMHEMLVHESQRLDCGDER